MEFIVWVETRLDLGSIIMRKFKPFSAACY